MKKSALILFMKYPERGVVKTRLARGLGNDLTYELYLRFLADLAAMARQVKAETIIAYSGPEGVSFPGFPGVLSFQQRGSDIGERMYDALQDAFVVGFERCVMVGSDSPDLPARLVNDALDKLASVDIVLGPSTDGGYYLAGCNRDSLRPSLFAGIPWSTAGVFSASLKRIAESGLSFAQLPQWSDIDEVDDLKRFYKRNGDRAATSQVMKFLKTKDIINER